MISYQIYKIMHLVGLMCVFAGLSALWGVSLMGPLERQPSVKRALAIIHGVGMLFLLVGGFGMLARLGIIHGGLPGWIWAKLALWFFLGGSMVLAKRKSHLGLKLIGIWVLAGGLAVYTAIYKPF